MDAEESRKRAAENARKEIDLVKALIKEAEDDGQLSLYIPIPLKEATIKHLEDGGYKIIHSDGTSMYKKWKLKISWK